jgi:hypothetical protein
LALKFLNNAKDRYSEKFLGVYYDDEPMGIPFDWDWHGVFRNGSEAYQDPYLPALAPLFQRLQIASETGQQPADYNVEAEWYHNLLMLNRGHNKLKQNNITTFTSDYMIYWYDFLGNYDTVFPRLSFKYNRKQQANHRIPEQQTYKTKHGNHNHLEQSATSGSRHSETILYQMEPLTMQEQIHRTLQLPLQPNG